MLYGCQNLYVYTDHKNNTFHNLQTQRVLRWRLFLEDFAVKFIYIKGEMNTLADALSRLPFNERQNPSSLYATKNLSDSPVNNPRSIRAADDDPLEIAHAHTSMADNADLIDCFVHLPPAEHVQFVLTYQMITQAQQGDAQLPLLRASTPAAFRQLLMATNMLVWCHATDPINDGRSIYLMLSWQMQSNGIISL
jgi:hypothetical protein